MTAAETQWSAASLAGRLWRLLISRRLAITLLIVIAGLLFLGILLPTLSYHDPGEMVKFERDHPVLFTLGKVFNPPTLATSRTFIVLSGLLLLSTLFCTIERIRNRDWRHPYEKPPHFFKHKIEIGAPGVEAGEVVDAAVGLLPAWRWQSRVEESKAGFEIEAVQAGAAWGFWGSIIFHLGFLVIVAGIIVSSYTRFSGSLLVTEGQSLQLAEKNFTQITREPGGDWPFADIEVTLNQLKTEIVGGRFPTDYTSRLTISRNGVEALEGVAKVNQAVKYGGLVFLLENYGFAPRFEISKGKRALVDAFFNLRGRIAGSRDSISVPDSNIEIKTVFYPDYDLTTNIEPTNPAFEISLYEAGRRLGKRLVRPGGEARIGAYTVRLADIKYWVYYRVNKDAGLPVIFWGFVVSALGLIVRFVLYDRDLRLIIKKSRGGAKISVEGQSRYFPALFEQEVSVLAEEIKKKIGIGRKERAAV